MSRSKNGDAGQPKAAGRSEVEELRAEVERFREACTEFENAYVGEREDRVAAEAKLRDVEALADEWSINDCPCDCCREGLDVIALRAALGLERAND